MLRSHVPRSKHVSAQVKVTVKARKWAVEAIFGLRSHRIPQSFRSAADAPLESASTSVRNRSCQSRPDRSAGTFFALFSSKDVFEAASLRGP